MVSIMGKFDVFNYEVPKERQSWLMELRSWIEPEVFGHSAYGNLSALRPLLEAA